MATSAPALARRTAVARPIPREPPVTNAFRPLRSIILSPFNVRCDSSLSLPPPIQGERYLALLDLRNEPPYSGAKGRRSRRNRDSGGYRRSPVRFRLSSRSGILPRWE